MNDFVMPLMLGLDVQSLAMGLVNISSPRGEESALADSLETALAGLAHLEVTRDDDTVIARAAGSGAGIVITARIDAPATPEPPLAYVEMGKLFGAGASDAKGSIAVAVKALARPGLAHDVTIVLHPGDVALDAPDGPVRRAVERTDAAIVLVASPTGSLVAASTLDHPLVVSLAARTESGATLDATLAGSAEVLGVPVMRFGPGDPAVAGTDGEFVPTAELGQCEVVLRGWLTE